MNIPENEAEFNPFANEPAKKKSNGTSGGSGAGVAWLALLLGLASISYSAFQWWQGTSEDPGELSRQVAIADLQQNQSATRQTLDTLANRLGTQESKDDSSAVNAIRSDLDALQGRLSQFGLEASGDQALAEAVHLTVADLSQRISDIETSVAALAVRNDTPGKKMDLAEVDYLLRLAGERLALFGDIASADIALGLADSQLQELDDPLYLAVRRKIDESRTALSRVPTLDIVQVSGKIAAIQSAVPGLPFPGETPVEVIVEDQPDAGWWQKIKNAIKPLVKVRRRVDKDLELTLEDKDFLRQGLWLQLESARLALIRRDVMAWDLSLSRATASLSNRFDSNSQLVHEANSDIEELKAVALVQELPDVSAPWRQLRLLREGRVSEPEQAEHQDEEEPLEDKLLEVESDEDQNSSG